MRLVSLDREWRVLLLFHLLICRIHELNVNSYILISPRSVSTLLGLLTSIHIPGGLPPRFRLVNDGLDLITNLFCFLYFIPFCTISEPVEVLIQVFDGLLFLLSTIFNLGQSGTILLSNHPHSDVFLNDKSHF